MFFVLLQEYARKALDFIWEKRQRSSNLVGVTINIHTGDWVRKGIWLSQSSIDKALERGKNENTVLSCLSTLMCH